MTAFSFGQSLPLTFEDGTTSASFEFGGLGFGNIGNPDMNVDNPSMRVLEVNKPTGAEWFGGFGFGSPTGPILADMSVGTSFTLKVWAGKAVPIRFELQRPGEVSYNVIQNVTQINQWVELTFDFTSQVNGSEQYSVIVIQPDYDIGCEGATPPCPMISNGALYYFDDIEQVGAAPPTCNDGIQNGNETGVDCGGPDCPACPPSCTDGIQNGNETGVDCGGPDCPPCDPTSGPVNNGSTGTDFYIYSELSGNPNSSDFTGFNLVDFAGGVSLSEPDLNGDTVLRADNLDFFGSGFGENFNATGTYSFVHINYYATSSTAFNFSLVDDSLSATICCGNPEEPFYRFGVDEPLINGSWQSVFIPLSHYANFPALVSGTWDGIDLKQTLFTGNGTVFIDNIFFSTTNTLTNEEFTNIEFKVFPNPTENNWTIVSNTPVSKVTIFDILGKEVLTVSPNQAVSTVDGSTLNTGVYFARITTDAGTESVKLIKN